MNKKDIDEYLDEIYVCIDELKKMPDKILEIAKIIKNSNHIFICGNGGSAATASHFTNDLQKMCGLKAYCLTDNAPLVTAYANDESYINIFLRQLETLSEKGDTLIVITGSGESKNIINALFHADVNDLNTIIFVGMDGGGLLIKKDKVIHIRTDMLHSEDWHLILCHLISYLIKKDKNE